MPLTDVSMLRVVVTGPMVTRTRLSFTSGSLNHW